jgi:hypothetical protein
MYHFRVFVKEIEGLENWVGLKLNGLKWDILDTSQWTAGTSCTFRIDRGVIVQFSR